MEVKLGTSSTIVSFLWPQKKDCGVFGVASDEYLGFALENREEWVIKGESKALWSIG